MFRVVTIFRSIWKPLKGFNKAGFYINFKTNIKRNIYIYIYKITMHHSASSVGTRKEKKTLTQLKNICDYSSENIIINEII